jgi:hypothetical protein
MQGQEGPIYLGQHPLKDELNVLWVAKLEANHPASCPGLAMHTVSLGMSSLCSSGATAQP